MLKGSSISVKSKNPRELPTKNTNTTRITDRYILQMHLKLKPTPNELLLNRSLRVRPFYILYQSTCLSITVRGTRDVTLVITVNANCSANMGPCLSYLVLFVQRFSGANTPKQILVRFQWSVDLKFKWAMQSSRRVLFVWLKL